MERRKRRIGATQWSSRRKLLLLLLLGLEQSLDWVLLKRLVLVMMEVLLLMVLLVVMEQVVVVVMLQRDTVIAQPVLGGLGHGLKRSYDACRPSLSLHQLLDGWAVLRLLMGDVPTIFSDRLPSNLRPVPSIRTRGHGDAPSLGVRASA